HVSNLFKISPQAEMAAIIQKHTFRGRTFFCNSGTEANEAAYKLALKYGRSIARDKIQILSAVKSFHGRTLASLALTGQPKYQESFKPLPGRVKYFKYNNLKDFKKKINTRTAAVFIETVQGEGGINIVQEKFLKTIRKLCSQYKALLIIDDVQAGCGRTGELFSFLNYQLKVDAFTAAKGIAGGFPAGCLTVRDKYKNILKPGDHASTFGGNPFVTAVGAAVVKETAKTSFLKQVKIKGNFIKDKFSAWQKELDYISDIRVMGMMAALDLKKPNAKAITAACLKKGLIVNAIGTRTIRLLPPLVIGIINLEKGLNILHKIIKRQGND
ncbi:MAG TPA: aminotransferase class III-fold pyridoxal phosphate-dependent enzyme, partial [Spirochaetota bacterium]|nr:aminotransferase class III-fold pyridoxal phosphate-dependent enzyme [Spirochaetota bacterium]